MDTAPATKNPVAVGDIFCDSWGYDQTNIDFWEVIAVSKTGRAKMDRIDKRFVGERGGPSDTVTPIPGSFADCPSGYRVIRYDNDSAYCNTSSWSMASRCKPDVECHQTGWGYGH